LVPNCWGIPARDFNKLPLSQTYFSPVSLQQLPQLNLRLLWISAGQSVTEWGKGAEWRWNQVGKSLNFTILPDESNSPVLPSPYHLDDIWHTRDDRKRRWTHLLAAVLPSNSADNKTTKPRWEGMSNENNFRGHQNAFTRPTVSWGLITPGSRRRGDNEDRQVPADLTHFQSLLNPQELM